MRLRSIVAAAGVMLAAAGCGGTSAYYQPYAWGPPGICYWVYSPFECIGHHPGVPMQMPLYWHERYATYYDSPAYIAYYVPSRYRTTATRSARTFDRAYASAILSSRRYATYRSSTGSRVSGSRVSSTATFAAGKARSTGFSGGSLRQSSTGRPCAMVREKVVYYSLAGFSGGSRSSFSSSGSSRSYSGGSARSYSGSSSRSYSGGSARSGSVSRSSSRVSRGAC